MTTDQACKTWYRNEFMVSTDRNLLQPEAINAAFESDLLWWSKRLSDRSLRKMIDNSLCIGLYQRTSATTSEDESVSDTTQMVGFARVVTDYVTFGYLDDVYILDAFQGKGLAKWMMECLNEVLEGWPELRHFMILTSTDKARKLYERTLGAQEWSVSPSAQLSVLERIGPGVEQFPKDGR